MPPPKAARPRAVKADPSQGGTRGSTPIAIIGAACRLPGAPDLDALWSLLASGTDAVGWLPAERFNQARFLHPRRGEPGRTHSFAAGTLGDITGFDAAAFGISPREAAEMDPQQRLLLEVTAEAIEDAGLPFSRLAGREAGVFIGSSATDYAELRLPDHAGGDRYFMTGNALSIIANRLTNVFDLRGPGQTIDTACSSSLVALHGAIGALAAGEVELAIAGGVHMLLSPFSFVGFSRAGMLSPSGRCRAFDAAADGYVRAEGAVVLLLKRLDAALAAGDTIQGVILGSGVNAAGRTVGLSLPNRGAQARLIGRVMAQAGVTPDRLGYFEAHGTGTQAGDPMEAWAIGTAAGTGRASPLPIGSLKTNLGHLEPVSGLAGLLKGLLVLRHGQVPATLHQHSPNPNIDFAALNIRVPGAMEPLAGHGPGAVVGVNSFGFGGTNATVLLGPAPPRKPGRAARSGPGAPPLLLSARSAAALTALAARWEGRLQGAAPRQVAALARGVAQARDLQPYRLALRGTHGDAMAAALAAWRDGGKPAGLVAGERAEPGGLCFVFSGNGAQWAGMGQAALAGSAAFRAGMAAVDAALAPLLGWSVQSLLEGGVDAEALAGTDIAQPLLFAIQVAMLPALAAQGIRPDMVLGHSVGEVAAAHAAGLLDLPAAARLVVARSRQQHRLRGQGRMAALAADAQAAAALIAELEAGAPSGIEVAAFNGPAAVTLAGPAEALARLAALAEARRINCVLLDLDYAFHSAAMEPVRGALLADLAGLPVRPPVLPMLSTVTGEALQGPAADAAYWWRNLRQPVRFEPALRAALGLGARLFLEIGPNPVLQSYIRETCRAAGVEAAALVSLSRREAAPGLPLGHQSLADPFPGIADRAFAAGADPRGGAAFAGPAERRLPATPFDRKPAWHAATSESLRLVDPIEDHPLLGFRQGTEAFEWRRALDTEQAPWLADHRLGADAVLPAAAMLELALAAGRARHPEAVALEVAEFRILQPLALEATRAREIRCRLGAEGSFRLDSRRRLSEDPWLLHAEGRVGPAGQGGLAAPEEAFRPAAEAAASTEGTALRALAATLGLTYGPAFAAVQSVTRDAGGAAARVLLTLPEAAPADAGFVLHPARLDGAFQGLFAMLDGTPVGLVPVRFARLVAAAHGGPAASADLRLTRRGQRSARASLVLRDGAGRVVARIEEATFQRLPRPATDPAEHAFRILLQPAAEGAAPPPALAAARAAARQGAAALDMREAALLLEAHVAAVAQEHWAEAVALTAAPEAGPYQAFLRRALVEDGAAEQGPTGIRLVPDAALPEARAIWRSVLDDNPALALDLAWIAEAAERLPEALRGMPRGGPPPAQGEALARLAAPLADAIAALAAAWPENRPLRILEVGATGVLARLVAARLAPLGRPVLYLAAGSQPGGAEGLGGAVEWREIAWDPLADAAPPALADLVVGLAPAARSRSGAGLVAALRPALAEGGALLLAEPLPGRVWTFVCGQDPAWWTGLGPGAEAGAEWGALPDAALWSARLAEAGFRAIEAEPIDSAPWPAVLLLGEAPAPPAAAPPSALPRLILADAASLPLATALVARLARRGSMAELQALEATPAPRALRGRRVLALASPEAAALPGALAALARLAEAAAGSAEDFVLATRGGAQPPDGRHVPEAAALLGLGRVLANEFPALRPRRIDLSPDLPPEAAARRLEAEWAGTEPEVTLLPAGRLTPRLMAGLDLPPPAGPLALAVAQPGRLGSLHWAPASLRAPGPGEVAIRVEAAGLNFRDLMWAQGLLPEEVLEAGFAGPTLGMECAGVVECAGPDVPLRPGTRVFGFVPGALAARALTRVEALATLPEGMDPVAAATMPVAFMTALHALEACAQLQPGETVLVHGGAGAVGLAALQVAQAIGARVAMTAGSPAKRAFLRAAGAELVLDSRDPGFADALRARWPEGVDVVLNSLAGEAMERSLGLLRPFGRFVELGKRDYVENRRAALRPLRRNGSYFAVDVDELPAARPALAARLLARIRDGLQDGTWRPLPARVFEAAEAEAAFRVLQASGHIGKLVIRPPAPRPATARPWAPDPAQTIVVVGGTRGFGLACAQWLARQGARHLALLGRRAEGDAVALRELAALGAQAALHACDAADPAALAATLAKIRAVRPIGGVVHAAGVLDDGAAIAMDEARFRRVLAPKLTAAENLDRLTSGDPLSLFLIFGSATTAFGNPGQANYVAANAALEALARRRRGLGRPALTVCWGPIADVGMLAEDQATAEKLHRRLGVGALTAEAALAALPALLAQDHAAPLLLRLLPGEARISLPVMAEPMLSALAGAAPAADQSELRALLPSLPRAEAEALILRLVAEEIGRVLRLGAAAITPDQPVVGLGLDSLGAVELRGALEQRLGLQVPMTALTEELTVGALARQIAEVALAPAATEASLASLVGSFEPEAQPEAGVQAGGGTGAEGLARATGQR
jgi:acyl transferase domain-containing protein/NADPH:quinone reductase-like Zn-dependent oxidoreductase/acyl carrier protein